MPLVTLTCSTDYFPPDSDEEPSEKQQMVVQLARSLPDVIIDHAHELLLDEGSVPEAVQVDLSKFHRYAVNNVDVWALVQFSELPPGKEPVRANIAHIITGIFWDWFSTHDQGEEFTWAVDVFWGPDHGALYTGDVRVVNW